MSEPVKLCKDCKKFNLNELNCMQEYMSLATGLKFKWYGCEEARADESKCGLSAKFWEPRDANKT
jgi:hypothetical protein